MNISEIKTSNDMLRYLKTLDMDKVVLSKTYSIYWVYVGDDLIQILIQDVSEYEIEHDFRSDTPNGVCSIHKTEKMYFFYFTKQGSLRLIEWLTEKVIR